MPLTDIRIRGLQPTEKPFKISDAGGLHVLVNPSGSKLWRYAYRFEGKQKLLALGAYPDVSLREARRARDEARGFLDGGSDPGLIRKTENRSSDVLTKVSNTSLSASLVVSSPS